MRFSELKIVGLKSEVLNLTIFNNWEIKLENELKLRGYSRKTLKGYEYYVRRFVDSGLEPKEFILKLINEGKSRQTVRTTTFAIKFYLNNVVNKDFKIDANNLPIQKRDKSLPVVLSKHDIEKMIAATNNFKHRAVIMLLYSAGLRLSELINLKWEDVDFQRNVIHIKKAKGGKDRVVMLSPKVKRILSGFYCEKSGYIFKTRENKKYSPKSIQLIVSNSAVKAGIRQKVTPHTLRHSFATHLLENGVDIRHIQELLGHSRVETTMIYTRVSNKDLSKIKSPIDS